MRPRWSTQFGERWRPCHLCAPRHLGMPPTQPRTHPSPSIPLCEISNQIKTVWVALDLTLAYLPTGHFWHNTQRNPHTARIFSVHIGHVNSLMCMPAWAGALGGGVSWQEWFGISPPPTQRHPTLNVVLRQPSALASLSHPQSTPFSSARVTGSIS